MQTGRGFSLKRKQKHLLRRTRHDEGSRAGKSEAWLVYTYDENNQRTSKYNTDRYLEWMNFNEYFGIYFSIPNKATGGQWQKSIMLGNTRIVTKIDQQHSAVQHYRDERTFYYLSDHIGNTTLITDYKGDVFQSTDYTPYGERWVENTGHNPEGYYLPFKFAGKPLDTETGYYYFGARYYEPRTSIWLTADPAMGEYFDNTSLGEGGVFNYVNLNPYHYGGNNPIKYVDPDGRTDAYFIYTYTDSIDDQVAKQSELSSIQQEKRTLERRGSTVKMIDRGTFLDIEAAFKDTETRLIVISGHGFGDDAAIQTAAGEVFSASDIPLEARNSKNLYTVIFEACYQGDPDKSSKWNAALGGDKTFVGWAGTTSNVETINFNSSGKNSRQNHNLMYYTNQVDINKCTNKFLKGVLNALNEKFFTVNSP